MYLNAAAVESIVPDDDHSIVARPGVVFDPPLIALLIANGITIAMALLQHWELGSVLLVYWSQSVTIGLFTFIRILMSRPAPEAGPSGSMRRLFLAGFFAFHYGLFHFVYLIFIVTFAILGTFGISDPLAILGGAGIFFANHLISFFWYRGREERDPDAIFIEPYHRIVPMHLTIILGGVAAGLVAGTGLDATVVMVLFFLVLKTAADVWAHQRQHAQATPTVEDGAP
jgi:hypothetical protein